MSEAPSFPCFQRNPSVTNSDTNSHRIQSEPPGYDQVCPRSKKRQLDQLAPPTPPTKLPKYPTQDNNPRNKGQHVAAISSRYQEKTIEKRSYELEIIKEESVSEHPECDGEVVGITAGNKQVFEVDQTHQKDASVHKQPESSSPRQQSWSNTFTLHDVISRIEQVGAAVEALSNAMDMKVEDIKQMIDYRTVKTKKGGFKLPGFKIKNGKKKE